MRKFLGSRTGLKLALVVLIVALVFAAILLNGLRFGGGSNQLNDAIEGGESAITAVGRGYESMMDFAKDEQDSSRELLSTAIASQEYADTKLNSARTSSDSYVSGMVDNYGLLLSSSHVISQGVSNLLAVGGDLDQTFRYYRQGAYEDAAQKASVCLQTLTPLSSQFQTADQSLDGINYQYIASGHRDRTGNAVAEYKGAMKIYRQYISLLETIRNGVNYSKQMSRIREMFQQLQHALSSQDLENARKLSEQIQEQLEFLKDPKFQEAVARASELDLGLLNGMMLDVAQDLKNQLKDTGGLDEFELCLRSLQKYMNAQDFLRQGNSKAAEDSIDEGLSLLSEGQGEATADLKNFYTALQIALNSMKMQIRGQPDQG
jgi:hypothetical protein